MIERTRSIQYKHWLNDLDLCIHLMGTNDFTQTLWGHLSDFDILYTEKHSKRYICWVVNRYVLIIFPNVLLAAFLCTHIVGTSIIHTLWGHFINTRYGDINDTHFIGTFIMHTLWGLQLHTHCGDILCTHVMGTLSTF